MKLKTVYDLLKYLHLNGLLDTIELHPDMHAPKDYIYKPCLDPSQEDFLYDIMNNWFMELINSDTKIFMMSYCTVDLFIKDDTKLLYGKVNAVFDSDEPCSTELIENLSDELMDCIPSKIGIDEDTFIEDYNFYLYVENGKIKIYNFHVKESEIKDSMLIEKQKIEIAEEIKQIILDNGYDGFELNFEESFNDMNLFLSEITDLDPFFGKYEISTTDLDLFKIKK